jgi:ectoine hydroxylase-related dioxygenase (phytanoyl-CoA dioxygenase family)
MTDADRVRATWTADGVAVVAGLVDHATVEACRRHLRGLADRLPMTTTLAVAPESDPFAEAVVADRRIVDLVEAVLDRPPRCFGYTYLVKAARTGPPALWHQDGYPWRDRWGITEAVTVWIALDEVTADSGALLVLPGSHRRPAAPLVAGAGWGPGMGEGPVGRAGGGGAGGGGGPGGSGPSGGGMFGAGVDPGPIAPADIRVLAMVPGDASLHHPCLVHGSGPNRSAAPRRALAIRYRAE